ncbi:nucleotidyltransferase domain-containing protein [archaeon]|nr:MAG: nucleotidyltransferase domain-containing protein [archaeon]
MIIEKESDIRVLRNFCNNPFDYFSIAEISGRTGISRNWIYTVINKFEKNLILSKSGKKHKLNFSNIFCKKLKLLLDSEYAILSPKKERIMDIANKILFEISPKSIVLVGSVAVQKMKEKSDIDFLVIGKTKKNKVPYFENTNIVTLSEKEFEEKYAKGDDFVISALIFGKIIHDTGFFIRFLENPLPIFSQELIQEKIKYCEILEERVYSLLKTDGEQAKEELLYLALQAARIVLLKNGIMPGTKHDIAAQVSGFDKEMEKIIKKLLEQEKISKRKMLDYIKNCMRRVRGSS